MLERVNQLKIDPVISQKFFEFHEERDFSVNVDFPLPPCAEMLPIYFTSAEGKQFKEALARLIDKLAAWSSGNGLNASACERFKSTYVDYSGSQADVNKLYIAFYQQGVPALAGIINLIESETIQLEFRKDKIRNLLGSIQVCAPGTHTNITDAYLELLAYSNLAMKWVSLRRKIGEQLVLELLKPFNVREGMEIHYVNAVLNRYADAIAIKMMEDHYVSLCASATLDPLCDQFSQEIHKSLTVESVIENVISDAELDLKKLDLSPAKFNDQLRELEHKLNHYGTEEERKGFFSIYDLFAANEGELCLPYQLSWGASYVIHASVFNRLKRSGYFNPTEMKKAAIDDVNVYFMPAHSLKLAYVEAPQPDPQLSPYKPFIPYCVQMLLTSEEKCGQWVRLIAENIITREQRFEIVEAIVQFVNSFECESRKDKGELLIRLVKAIHGILLHEYKWDIVLNALPDGSKRSFLDGIDKVKLSRLILNVNQLTAVLKSQPVEIYAKFLSEVAADVLRPIREDGVKMINALSRIDVHQRAAFLAAIDPGALKIILAVIQNAKRMFEVLDILPESHRALLLNLCEREACVKIFGSELNAFLDVLGKITDAERGAYLLKIGPEIISVMKPDGFNLAKIIAMLPIETRAPYLFKVSIDLLRGMLETAYITEDVLNLLPEENRYVLLRNIGPEALRKMFDADHKPNFYTFLRLLPECNRGVFLQDIGVESLLKIVDTDANLDSILKLLPAINRITLLHELGSQAVKKFVNNHEQLLQLLSHVSEQCRPVLRALKIITIEMCRSSIKDANQLASLVQLFPQEYRKKLYGELGMDLLQAVIKDRRELLATLNLLPASVHAAFIDDIKTILKSLVQDINQFIFFIQTLPHDHHGDFVNALGSDAIWAFLKNGNDMAAVLKALPEDKRTEFLLIFTPTFLQHVYQDVPGLTAIMQTISPQSYQQLFNKVGAAAAESLIKNGAGMLDILKGIPETAYPEFMRALGPDLFIKIIPDYKEMIHVCKKLPKLKQQAFHDMIAPEILRRIIKSVREFTHVYKSYTDENILLYMNKYFRDASDEQLRAIITDRHMLAYVMYWGTLASRIRILDRLGNACLQTLLLHDKKTPEVLQEMGKYSSDQGHYHSLLVATLRAYREQRASNPKANLHWYGSLFRAPDRDKKLAEADRLDAAIRSGDYGYFDKMTIEQRSVAEDGALGEIASAFRNGRR